MNVFHNFLIALDQALNTLIRIDGEYGQPNETLSARLWRKGEYCTKRRRVVDALFFWQSEHCAQSYLNELARNKGYGNA